MAVVITVAPDAVANSYVSLVDAETYHESVLNNTEWTTATTDEKNRGLVMATRLLDPLDWQGYKTDALADNALRWPRSGVLNEDDQAIDGSTIPELLENATSQLAFELIKADRLTDVNQSKAAGTKRAKVGPLEIESFEGDNDGSYLPSIPFHVLEMVSPLTRTGISKGFATLIRG